MSELNGHVPNLEDTVAGDEESGEVYADPVIYVHGQFHGGPEHLTRVRDVSVSIPVRPGDSYADYVIAIEAAVREIGHLGYLPGYEAPDVTVGKGTAPSWEQPS